MLGRLKRKPEQKVVPVQKIESQSNEYRNVLWANEDLYVTKKAYQLISQSESLSNLGLIPAAIWESDDSSEAYQTVASMIDYAKLAGGRVVMLSSYDTIKIDRASLCRAGKYMYVEA